MKNIAVVINQTTGLPKMISKEDRIFISYSWILAEDKTESLVGGMFSAHDKQSSESQHQGTILEVVPVEDGRYAIVYKLSQQKVQGRNLKWGQEKAYY